jgi:hypothetical protein
MALGLEDVAGLQGHGVKLRGFEAFKWPTLVDGARILYRSPGVDLGMDLGASQA